MLCLLDVCSRAKRGRCAHVSITSSQGHRSYCSSSRRSLRCKNLRGRSGFAVVLLFLNAAASTASQCCWYCWHCLQSRSN